MGRGIGGVAAPLLMLTAVGHAIVGGFLFLEPLSEMVRDGVVNSIQPPMYSSEPHFDRAAAFWFLLFTPVLLLLGQIVRHAVSRRDTRLLRLIGWYLIGIGAVATAILPLSGNWLLPPLGVVVLMAARS